MTGRVGADGLLRFPGIGSFARPSSYAVFNCSVPPFVTSNDVMGNLTARIAAALNRGTLLANANQPDATADRVLQGADDQSLCAADPCIDRRRCRVRLPV